jgi:hypothetical protein
LARKYSQTALYRQQPLLHLTRLAQQVVVGDQRRDVSRDLLLESFDLCSQASNLRVMLRQWRVLSRALRAPYLELRRERLLFGVQFRPLAHDQRAWRARVRHWPVT